MVQSENPLVVVSICASICAIVLWTTGQPWAARFYKVVPSILLIYFLPAIAASAGILPLDSPAYDWMRDYLLPFSLFILMVTTDLPAILRVGPRALGMMLFGTLGVILGGPLALVIFRSWLPPESWKGLAALAGSWIGGSGNFAALKESVGAPDSIIGPVIVVDTMVAYSWMGILLFLANHQRRFDRWTRASSDTILDLNRQLKEFKEKEARPILTRDVCIVFAVGLVGTLLFGSLGFRLHEITEPLMLLHAPGLAPIFSSFTWMVIILTAFGILLSLTPLRGIEKGGASRIAYATLFIFLASIGAKADLSGLLETPLLLAVGLVWILVHVLVLMIGARLIRAPLFLLAVGSQANIGGPASAPIVAAAYYEGLAPVGVLLGLLGYLLGNYGALLCAFLLRSVS